MARFSYNLETAQIELSDADGNRMSIGYVEEVALFPQKSKQAVAALNAVLELVVGKSREPRFGPLTVLDDGRQETVTMK